MSDMLNHYYCGRAALAKLPEDSPIRQLILQHYDAFRLGTQGPDFFYYHFPFPWQPYSSLHNYGTLIHTQKIDAFFYYGLKYAFTSQKERAIILSYLAGFTCHHALDTSSHPYIFNKTGCYDEQDASTRIFSYWHKTFEVLLDVAFLQYAYGKTASSFSFEKLFSPTAETADALESLYAFMMGSVYQQSIKSGFIHDALKDIRTAASLFPDPHKRKQIALQTLEQCLQEKGVLSRCFYPLYTDELSVLNLAHHPWQHPCTGETSTESYPQLFDKAVEKTTDHLLQLDKLILSPHFTLETIHQIYQNQSYDTGLPCGQASPMQYFDYFFTEK